MHYTTISKFAGTALLLALTTISVSPAQAEIQTSEQLISQLRGHNTYRNEPQLELSDFVIGRVRGTSGGIMSVQFIEPVTVGDRTIGSTRAYGDGRGGDDVLFQIVDDQLVYFGLAEPTWISRLILKEETDFVSDRSALWRQLEEPNEFGLPPLAPDTSTRVEAPVPPVEPPVVQPEEPVPGLW